MRFTRVKRVQLGADYSLQYAYIDFYVGKNATRFSEIEQVIAWGAENTANNDIWDVIYASKNAS